MSVPTLGRVLPLVRRGDRPVCAVLPGAGGGLQPYFRLAGFFGETHNVYGVRAAGLVPGEEPETSVAAMAASALRGLDAVGATPEVVFGWSMGGVVGWELCALLADRGVRPDLVLLDSSPLPRVPTGRTDAGLLSKVVSMLGGHADAGTVERVRLTVRGQIEALSVHRTVQPYSGRVLLITCADPDPERAPSVAAWRELATDLREARVDVDHFDVLDQAHLPDLARLIGPFLGHAAKGVR